MLTFKDLHFEDGTAILNFKNGYGCIVKKNTSNTNKWNCYEFIQTMKGVPYFHPQINDGPVGYCTEEDISLLLEEVQNLKYC